VLGGCDNEIDPRLAQIGPRTSACTYLEMRDCRFHTMDLRAILLLPKVLRTFIYEIGQEQLHYCTVSFSTIREGLEHHKETLEELCLDDCRDRAAEQNFETTLTALPMGSLKGFLQLKRLKIAPVFILGEPTSLEVSRATHSYLHLIEFLPASIQQLHYTQGEANNLQILLNAVGSILDQKTARFPALSRVIIDIDAVEVDKRIEGFRNILTMAKINGRSFVLRSNFARSQLKRRDRYVERKWGFHEDIEWKDCDYPTNQRPVFEVMKL
jgi:hypothetical protein